MSSPTTLQKETVPNLVQGVSQQAQQVRRSSQCDSQFDCLNQPIEGCTPRPGLEHLALLSTADNTDAFFYHIVRTTTERYTIVIRKDGTLKAYNFLTGVECTVDVINADATAYLNSLSGDALPWNSYAATSANDVTFIANKLVSPIMDATSTSPTRPYEALFFIRGGEYLNSYTIGVNYLGTWYNWTYTTPDNSVPANAAYIAPSNICAALYNAMVTDPTHSISTGTGGLGFNIERTGNLIRLWRNDVDFNISTDDGQNNTFMLGLKDAITSFDQLPQSGYDGMVFKVAGDPTTAADDYYVVFNSKGITSDSTTNGAWEETVAPDTVTAFDAGTMPVSLVNDDVNHFTLGLGDWGARLVGDGVNSAKDPSFIGSLITDMFFDQQRLAIMTEASTVWSRTRNPFVFFPDTIQADLDTAPIDEVVQASKRLAILRHPLQVSTQTFLWAEGQQFSVGLAVSYTQRLIFSDQTIKIDLATSFEWNDEIAPQQIGDSVIFCNEIGEWTTFTDATYNQGQNTGATGISDHVAKYVPKDVRVIAGSDTVKKLAIYSEQTPNLLYIYEYRIDQGNRLQSAFNTWRLPTDCHILYAFMDTHLLYVWVQRPDGMHLLRCSLQPSQEDPEGGYLTRLDMRVTEAGCAVVYSAATQRTTITLPYDLSDDNAYLLATPDNPTVQIVVREGDATYLRGTTITANEPEVSFSGGHTVVSVGGDFTGVTFYAGLRIRAERTENTFYQHDPNDAYIFNDRVQVVNVVVSHSGSGYFRAEVQAKNGRLFQMPYDGKEFGDPASIYDAVVLGQGEFNVPVGQLNTDCQVRLVADTYLPCAWEGLTWFFNPTQRAA